MEASDLEMVLRWRNHEKVRRFMFTRQEISLEEHRAWFHRESADPRNSLMIFEEEEVPRGFVKLRLMEGLRSAEWGFYSAPGTQSGTGHRLGKAALRHAFTVVRVHKVCGQAIACNEGSIRLHERLGFKREGVLREQYHDGKTYRDVVCFGLLNGEWERMTNAE